MLPPPNPIFGSSKSFGGVGGFGGGGVFPFTQNRRKGGGKGKKENDFVEKKATTTLGRKKKTTTNLNVIKSDSNSSNTNNTNAHNTNAFSNKRGPASSSSSKEVQKPEKVQKPAGGGGGGGKGWREKLSGWSAAASSWSAKTIEGGSNSFSKAVTDFNRQFKPQMEVAVDVVGPTWDRAVEIAKPVTGPLRDAWLGLSPQTRAFVKPAATGTAVAHVILGFPSRRYARKLERKITEMEKERVQLMVDDFSLEKEVLTLSAENRRLEKRVLRSEMALHAIRRRVAEFSLPNTARDAYRIDSNPKDMMNGNDVDDYASAVKDLASSQEMAWRKTQALKDAGALQERDVGGEQQNVYENGIQKASGSSGDGKGNHNWSIEQNMWALGATVAAEEASSNDGSAGTFLPPKY